METISPQTTLLAFGRKHFETSLSILDDDQDNQPSVLLLKDGRPSAEKPVVLGLMDDFGAMLTTAIKACSDTFLDYCFWNYVRLQSIFEAYGNYGDDEILAPITEQIVPDEYTYGKSDSEIYETCRLCLMDDEHLFRLYFYGKLNEEDFPITDRKTRLKRIEIQK